MINPADEIVQPKESKEESEEMGFARDSVCCIAKMFEMRWMMSDNDALKRRWGQNSRC